MIVENTTIGTDHKLGVGVCRNTDGVILGSKFEDEAVVQTTTIRFIIVHIYQRPVVFAVPRIQLYQRFIL